ncbi:MAG TPA: hypothetical protein PLZ45_10945 [Ferruginibacter sp.]|nr:hypothetical protein [Chitinophagaceae bacterium]HRI25185.1 hypothetical protein [Ferruginibacter sp.]
MIEVFKTNVQTKTQARRILEILEKGFSEARINFDLADCDKILRVDGITEAGSRVIVNDLHRLGFSCEVLN